MSETTADTTGGNAAGFDPQRTALLVIDPVNDFLSDAIGAESLPAYEPSIHVNYPLIANMVMEVDEFLAGLAAPGQQMPAPGDTVVGSDRGEIGEVVEVVAGNSGAPGYVLVKRGLIFDRDTYIPLNAVTHRMDGRVYITVPKLVIGKLPWGEPPSSAAAREKLGELMAKVEMLYGSFNPTGPAGR